MSSHNNESIHYSFSRQWEVMKLLLLENLHFYTTNAFKNLFLILWMAVAFISYIHIKRPVHRKQRNIQLIFLCVFNLILLIPVSRTTEINKSHLRNRNYWLLLLNFPDGTSLSLACHRSIHCFWKATLRNSVNCTEFI